MSSARWLHFGRAPARTNACPVSTPRAGSRGRVPDCKEVRATPSGTSRCKSGSLMGRCGSSQRGRCAPWKGRSADGRGRVEPRNGNDEMATWQRPKMLNSSALREAARALEATVAEHEELRQCTTRASTELFDQRRRAANEIIVRVECLRQSARAFAEGVRQVGRDPSHRGWTLQRLGAAPGGGGRALLEVRQRGRNGGSGCGWRDCRARTVAVLAAATNAALA